MNQVRRLARAVGVGAFTCAAAVIACGPTAARPTAPAAPPAGPPAFTAPAADAGAGPAPAGLDAGVATPGPDAVTPPPAQVIDRVIAGEVDATPPAGVAPPGPSAPRPVAYPLDLDTARDSATISIEARTAEEQLRSLPSTDPEYPALIRRLADLYRELASESRRSGDLRRSEDAERKALEHLQRLRDEFPRFCATANPADPRAATGCGDEVLYLIGRGYQRLQARDQARPAYGTLIERWPSSPYVPAAYFAFGDLFLAEGATDPLKLELAERAYGSTIANATPEHLLFGAALARTAYVQWQRGDLARALSSFKRTIEHAAGRPTMPGAAERLARARAELPALYALAGDPRRGFDFFRPLAADPDGSALAMVDTQRSYLVGRGAYADAVLAARDAIAHDRSSDRSAASCLRWVAIAELQAWGARAPAADVLADVDRLLDEASRDASADRSCRRAAAESAIAIALAWDVAIVGSAAAPGPRDADALDRLLALYQLLIDRVPDAVVTAAAHPRLAPADRPTRAVLVARRELVARLRP